MFNGGVEDFSLLEFSRYFPIPGSTAVANSFPHLIVSILTDALSSHKTSGNNPMCPLFDLEIDTVTVCVLDLLDYNLLGNLRD